MRKNNTVKLALMVTLNYQSPAVNDQFKTLPTWFKCYFNSNKRKYNCTRNALFICGFEPWECSPVPSSL